MRRLARVKVRRGSRRSPKLWNDAAGHGKIDESTVPAVLKIDRQRRIVSSTFYGEVAGNDLLQHRERIKADHDFDPSFAEVVDFSGVSIVSVSESALSELAGSGSLFAKHVPHVVITPADLPMNLALKYRNIARETRPNFYMVRTLGEAQELLRGLGYGL